MGWEEQMSVSHIPEESLFLANEMTRQMPSIEWRLASPQGSGHRVLEAHGQDRWGRGVDRNGAAWLHQWGGGSHGMGHHCPMAPSVF